MVNIIVNIIGFIGITGFVSALVCTIKNGADKQFDEIFKDRL